MNYLLKFSMKSGTKVFQNDIRQNNSINGVKKVLKNLNNVSNHTLITVINTCTNPIIKPKTAPIISTNLNSADIIWYKISSSLSEENLVTLSITIFSRS